MYYIQFCRAPSQMWVGCVMYKNGAYFASGRTLDHMVESVKKRLYQVDRVPFSSVVLESKQSLPSELPLAKMSKIFRTKYWLPKDVELDSPNEIKGKEMTTVEPKKQKETKEIKKDQQQYEYYTHKVVDGKLIVYGYVKVAEYNLEKSHTQFNE